MVLRPNPEKDIPNIYGMSKKNHTKFKFSPNLYFSKIKLAKNVNITIT